MLDIIYGHEPWMSSGACASVGGDAWFPSGHGREEEPLSETGKNAALAKRICRTRCPVREECLEYALRTDQRTGIWGGVGSGARKKMKPKTPSRSPAGRVQRPKEPDMADEQPEKVCICTPGEIESGKFFKDCPRHRQADPPWTGSDDWA